MKEILYCNTFSNQLNQQAKGNRDHSTYCFALIRHTDMVKVQQFQNICMKSVKIEKQAKGRKSYRYNTPGRRGDCLTNVTFYIKIVKKFKLHVIMAYREEWQKIPLKKKKKTTFRHLKNKSGITEMYLNT